MFFNAHKSKPSSPSVRPIEEQEPRESQRLWAKTAKAVKERNHELATDEKTKVEDMQREEAAARANEGVEWTPRLFRRVSGGPGGVDEGEEDLEWIINAQMYVLSLLPSFLFSRNPPPPPLSFFLLSSFASSFPDETNIEKKKTVMATHRSHRPTRFLRYIPSYPARHRDATAQYAPFQLTNPSMHTLRRQRAT